MGVPGSDAQAVPKRVKRVPKGTSAYQAAWIFDDEDEESVDDDDADDDDDEDASSDIVDDDEIEPGKEENLVSATHGPSGKAPFDIDEADELVDVELDARSEGHQEMTVEEEEAQ